MVRSPEAAALTDLILETFRVNGDLLDAGDRLTNEFRQTSSRWQVLGALSTGPQTVAGVAREMGLARQSVQRTVDILAAEGLLESVDNPGHRRAKLIRLTARGTEVLGAIAERQTEWTNALGEAIGLDVVRISDATDVLRQLRTELERPQRHTTGEPTAQRVARSGCTNRPALAGEGVRT